MSLQERTRKYEILVRFNEDGSIGAHSQSITEIVRDGEIISSFIDSPIQLSIDDLKTLVQGLEQ